jgi:glycosyltransferase involved in cell wall biosynthesis
VRVKVAYFSPMPPEQTGIADYSALLLPALERRIDVKVVGRGRKKAPRGTDVSLYQVGNNPDAHAWIVDALRGRPGVVVLHDFVVHHLVAGMTIGRRDGHGYLDLMEREHGVVGRLLAHGVLDKRIPPLWESRPEDFPLASFVLEHATGVIVHSRYVRDLVRSTGYPGPVLVVPHPAWPVPTIAPERVADGVVIGCFGVVNASKRIPELLRATAKVRESHPEVTLLLVGPTSPGFDLERRLQRLGLVEEGLVRVDRRVAALGADGRVGHPREPPAPDHGRDVRQRDSCALARQAVRGERRGVVLRASRRDGSEDPGG